MTIVRLMRITFKLIVKITLPVLKITVGTWTVKMLQTIDSIVLETIELLL